MLPQPRWLKETPQRTSSGPGTEGAAEVRDGRCRKHAAARAGRRQSRGPTRPTPPWRGCRPPVGRWRHLPPPPRRAPGARAPSGSSSQRRLGSTWSRTGPGDPSARGGASVPKGAVGPPPPAGAAEAAAAKPSLNRSSLAIRPATSAASPSEVASPTVAPAGMAVSSDYWASSKRGDRKYTAAPTVEASAVAAAAAEAASAACASNPRW